MRLNIILLTLVQLWNIINGNHIECEFSPFCLARNPVNLAALAVKNKNNVEKQCNAFSSLGSVQFLPPLHLTADDQDIRDQVI